MKTFTFTKSGRALVLALAVVMGAVCVSYGQTRPAALAAQWVAADGVGAFRENFELFKDGTGIETNAFGKSSKIFWRVEGNRFVIERGGRIAASDYSLKGHELRFGTGSAASLYIRIDKVKEYAEKLMKEKEAAQNKKAEEERRAGDARTKEAESRIERLSKYFTDSRDGQKYRIVKIGDKVWMAQNLNYLPQSGNSWCYNNDNSYCAKYGRLYDWETAMKVCPLGSHLPSNEEFEGLKAAAGGGEAGKALRSVYGWTKFSEDSYGTDEFGFSALPGGYYNGNFSNDSTNGQWWTSTRIKQEYYSHDDYYSWYMLYGDDRMFEGDIQFDHSKDGYSVRCVRD